MRISGLQKLTLLDYPGKTACTIFTGGCNFRCPFCHNAALVIPEQLESGADDSEIMDFLRKRVGILEGVAVTGGEPLLHSGMADFLKKVKELGYSVKLDTNGSFPDHLEKLIRAGLVDRVAMDIKNSPRLYGNTVGIEDFDIAPVECSKNLLLSGEIEYEFRTTVVKGIHTEESLLEAAGWIEGAKEYYLQQYKDSGNIIASDGLQAFDEKEMHALADTVSGIIPSVKVRGI